MTRSTARPFDPVFSTALRNELEGLADGPARAPRSAARRPQLWVALVTAVVLVAATVGVLRLTHPPVQPAAPRPAVVDPLARITDPRSPYYVARVVDVLADAQGVGSAARPFDVPKGVSDLRIYLNCSGSAKYTVEIDREGGNTGSACDGDTGTNYSEAVLPGAHRVGVRVAKGVRWALLIIRTPDPTVSTGALIDPATAIADPTDPDSIDGDTTPLGRAYGTGDGVPGTLQVPRGVRRVRVLLVCRTPSAAAQVVIDGRTFSGCMNSIAHWADLTLTSRTVDLRETVPAGVRWSLLVVRAPKGTEDSPESTVLPYPATGGRVLARSRGAGAEASGTYVQPHDDLGITTTCRGTGWLEIRTGTGGTTTRGSACSTSHPESIGFGGEGDAGKHTYTVIPHGDISWTIQLTDDH